MKYFTFLILTIYCMPGLAQNLQLHYDLRHTVDPAHNPQNFPTLYFEYFKAQTDTSSFIKPGSFFIKMETDLQGQGDNIGKAFVQASQTMRMWKPKIYLSLQYSGGLGVTQPRQYSYYIQNGLSIGPSYLFQWQGAYFSTAIYYTYNMLQKPSNDLLYTLYWGKGFWNYKLEFAGDVELYSLNKDQGDAATANFHGKTISFFGEPQIWLKVKSNFAVGSKVLLYYHVITSQNVFEAYPTVAVRVKF